MKLESIIDARAKHVHKRHRLISENHTRKLIYKQIISKLGAQEEVSADLDAGEEFQIVNPDYPDLPITFLVGQKFTLIHSYLYHGGDGFLSVFPSDGIVSIAPLNVGYEFVVKDHQGKIAGRFYGTDVYDTLVTRCGMQGDPATTNRFVLKRLFDKAFRELCLAAIHDAEAEGIVSDKERSKPGYPAIYFISSCAKKLISLHPECAAKHDGLSKLAVAMSIVNTTEKWHPEAIKRTAALIAGLCREEPALSDGAILMRYINQEKPANAACLEKINALPRECVDSLDLQIRSNAKDLVVE